MKHINNNRARIRRLFFWALAIFVLVFILRFSYELIFPNNNVSTTASFAPSINFEPFPLHRHVQNNEKTANLSSVSHNFDQDHGRLRALIDAHDAVVQTENLHGLPGNQVLTITIGVMPQQFDGMVDSLRELGTLRSFTVNRVDKTNEFNSLLAHQEVLRMTRESYAALQQLGGSIQDMLLLQERILAVETELQHLSVDLGVFATAHSFCTINFVLREQAPSFISIQFVLDSAFDSFLWTLGAVAIVSFTIVGLLAAVAFGLWLRIKISKQLQVSESKEKQDE